ncbi:hypothetical protein THRCLA_08473 [Thraustotheca clavata]|uniref:Uncharacterized protein n=1 Tax=Thraustotheca clavata TaxID=74557 RepID=A0A1V9Z5V4_9STRA|nr:hypothetical protein THRCLA_08473 [Thraustotheca clavata]
MIRPEVLSSKQFSMHLETRGSTPIENMGMESTIKQAIALDGFLLLDTCRVEFPEEASRADVNGTNITSVIADDLQYFTNLSCLDMSDNQAPFEPLGALPVLKELDFQCNALHKITNLVGFDCLEWLNLSFNCLVGKDIEELSKLPKLRELYLASNWITSLPPVMDRFARLETLSLERNNIQGIGLFLLLAVAPRLRNLNLSHNKITEFPENALTINEKPGTGFYSLIYLNLAHNKITSENDIMPIMQMQSLTQLVLYGNPLAHAAVQTQDKTKLLYNPVPNMSEYALEGKETPINIVIAYPETKRKKSSYQNINIARVRHDVLPTCAEFKARGKRALFFQDQVRPEITSIFPPRVSKSPVQQDEVPEEPIDYVQSPDLTFLTGVGLENTSTKVPKTQTQRRIPKDAEALKNDVPSYFLARSLASNTQSQQVKLKTAMASLRYQLNHPLTSHNDEKMDDDVSAFRSTTIHRIRQRKKHDASTARDRFALANVDKAIDEVNSRLHNRVDILDNGDVSLNHLVRQANRMMRK